MIKKIKVCIGMRLIAELELKEDTIISHIYDATYHLEFESEEMDFNLPQIGIVVIPDHSNGPKGRLRPPDCHCHCAIVFNPGGPEHEHRGLGGWWENDNCVRCLVNNTNYNDKT